MSLKAFRKQLQQWQNQDVDLEWASLWQLLLHEDVSYNLQGMEMLTTFGSECLAMLMQMQKQQLVLLTEKKWRNPNVIMRWIVEHIHESDIWEPFVNLGCWDTMIVHGFGGEAIAEVPEKFQKIFLEWSLKEVSIPLGSYLMGSRNCRDTQPIHEESITQAFAVCCTPVTQLLWFKIMQTQPSSFEGAHRPVESMTWWAALEFCNKLSIDKGLEPVYTWENEEATWDQNRNGYRLLTEVEWEYVARANKKTTYSGAQEIEKVAWYTQNSAQSSQIVGTKQANNFGLYDMSGNINEWCWDVYAENYHSGKKTDMRCVRGGSWGNSEEYLTVWNRLKTAPENSGYFLGFRICRSIFDN